MDRKMTYLSCPPPPKTKRSKGFRAFTLAEVLITLTIIGVIAAITIPNLMNKYTEHVTITKVKEADSLLKNALKIALNENGPLPDYIKGEIANGKTGSQAVLDYLKTGLKVEKDCGTSATNCRPVRWASCSNKTWTDYRSASDRCLILKNSMVLCINREAEPNANCNRNGNKCAIIHIDINGSQGPNQYSRDDFWWVIDNTTKLDTFSYSSSPNVIGCSGGRGNDDASRTNSVKWILLKGNMDYLHKTVSW